MICRLGVCEKETTWWGLEIMMSSGSTREQFRNNKKAWSIFKKPPRERRNSRDDFIEENII